MADLIGFAPVVDHYHALDLKRAAMLFDRVIIWGQPSMPVQKNRYTPADLLAFERRMTEARRMHSLLRERGVLSDFDAIPEVPPAASAAAVRVIQEMFGNSEGHVAPEDFANEFFDRIARYFGVVINRTCSVPVVPLLRSATTLPPTSDGGAVIRAVLYSLPVPTESTPWQAILDWRADAEARKKYRRLRAWLHDVANRGLTTAAALDELGTLADDYEAYMKVEHERLSRGRVEIVLTTFFEAAEELLRFRPSRAVRNLFELKSSRLTLEDAELSAPGRAVAYVVALRKKFGTGAAL